MESPLRSLRDARVLLDRRVWLLTYGQTLLSMGRGVLMPFATIYFYDEKHFPLALIGLAFAVALPTGALVGLAWGALADRIGRKPLMVLGFAGQAVSTAALAFVEEPGPYVLVVVTNALFLSAWNPAARAMVADVTPPDRRARGYGLLYLANNLGLSLGLVVGGLAAVFLPIRTFFFAEAAGAFAFMLVVVALVRESHRPGARAEVADSGLARIARHLRGLSTPLRDPTFLVYAFASTLAGLGWAQFYITYSPFLKDYLGAPLFWIGIVFAINTVMVVALQIPIAARVDRTSRTRAFLVANYLLAWSLVLTWAAGRAGSLALALALVSLGIAVMTVGEIMVAPLGSVVAAGLARTEGNFGKYMAAQDLVWTVSGGLGSILGGLFFDVGRPMLLWPVCATLVVASFFGFLWLGRRLPPDVERPRQSVSSASAAPAIPEA